MDRSASHPRRIGAENADAREHEAIDVNVMKAFSHELRQRILVACTERVASPSELADEWGESRSGLAYHFRVLRDLGALELVREERVNGSVKHYYTTVRRTIFDDDEFAHFPVDARHAVLGKVLRRIVADMSQAARRGGFDVAETHVSRCVLNLDDEAFAEVSRLLIDLANRVVDLDAESDARRARGESTGEIPTELAILHFLREPR